MRKPQVIIFDLDGTLLDTLDDLADAANKTLASVGLPVHPAAAYRYFVGEGVVSMLQKAAAPATVDTAQLVAGMKSEYGSGWARKTQCYSGICLMLEQLALEGIRFAVLSNKPDYFTQIMVKHFFPTTQFIEVCGQKEGIPPKPHPQAALAIAQSFGVAPEDIYFMGDSKTDMETAVAAGMPGIGVTWGFRDEAELRAHGAKVILHSPQKLSLCWHE